MTNNSIRAAFERMWQHTMIKISEKINKDDIFETIGNDTITWDGVADGRYNVNGLAYLVSDEVPTLDELKQGGTLINQSGRVIPFTESNIVDTEQTGSGTGCYVVADSIGQPAVFVVYRENATFGMVYEGQTIDVIFEKKGVYFVDGRPLGLSGYITSLTINNYNEFNKREVIKNKYLNIFETGDDTLTWDGNTEGLYNLQETVYHISDMVPTSEDLKNGGTIKFIENGEPVIYPFAFENVASLGPDIVILLDGLITIVFKPNTTYSETIEGVAFSVTFEKSGIYFAKDGEENYVNSLAINDYRTIKEKYLPKQSWNNLNDKPFEAEFGEIKLYPTTTIAFERGSIQLPDIIEIEEGKEYIITYDGVKYKCISKHVTYEGMGGCVLGNYKPLLDSMGIENDAVATSEPFAMAIIDKGAAMLAGFGMLIFADPTNTEPPETEEHIMSIGYEGEIVHHLDSKFIKDMYYTEYSRIELLSETVLDLNNDDNMRFLPNIILIDGNKYEVVWNGVSYIHEAKTVHFNQYNETYIMLGNIGALDDTGNTGEPFVVFGDENITFIKSIDESVTSATVSISEVVEEVHQIDKKYIPDYDLCYEKNVKLCEVTEKNATDLSGLATVFMLPYDETEVNSDTKAIVKLDYTKTDGTTESIDQEFEIDYSWYGDYEDYPENAYEVNIGSNLIRIVNGGSFISGVNDVCMVMLLSTGYESLSLSIEYHVLKKLDEKFLPDGFGSSDDSYVHPDTHPATMITTDSTHRFVTDTEKEKWNSNASGVGKNVTGTVYTIKDADGNDTQITAKEGAEIFNSYSSNKAVGLYSHAEGCNTLASGGDSHAEGWGTTASATFSHAEGYETVASGIGSHAEGANRTENGEYSLSPRTISSSDYPIIENDITIKGSEARGTSSHAEGVQTLAFGYGSHSEGEDTMALGRYSHTEGENTIASGQGSHAEGSGTTASGDYSHTEGRLTVAFGEGSHAEGYSINSMPSTITPESTNDEIIAAWNS